MLKMLSRFSANLAFFHPFRWQLGYIGWIGFGNLGDEAIFHAIQKLFPTHNMIPFRHTSKIACIERLFNTKLYDAILFGGGTLLYSTNYGKILQRAQKLYPDLYVFGAGVRNPQFWEFNRKKIDIPLWNDCLRKCRFVGVRGPDSQKILEENGFSDAEVIGDPALTLGIRDFVPRYPGRRIGINFGRVKGKMWGAETRLFHFLRNMLQFLKDSRYELVFYPMCEQDLEVARDLLRQIGGGFSICPEYKSIDEVMQSLNHCDIFIGEKLHSVILAHCAHVPALSFGYRPKCADYMASMGMSEFNLRTDEVNVELVDSLVQQLFAGYGKYRTTIFEKVLYYQRLQKQFSERICDHMIRN
ncbi:MAG: hypothetical protein GF333_00560 [Candidatus Omnitrophica bacterium]|nr:hypothetical protein [Candidatus Omnitrophota bacterium]